MTGILNSAQMRAIEAAAFATGTVTSAALMERAGETVVDAVLHHWPELAEGRWGAVVLCGPGNNGGDGYVIARLLAARGWTVGVRALGDVARLPPDAKANHDRWVASGGVVHALTDAAGSCDLLVDALFGIGLTRPYVAPQALARAAARVVAVDVPSGLDADTGAFPDSDFRADLTVTFHRAKWGHYLGQGPDVCGRLVVADIGLGARDAVAALVGPPLAAALAKGGGAHKFGHGHALVLTGGVGRGGAARLAARAALRVGAGLVTVGCPPEAVAENAARLDAVMLRPVADAAALGDLLGDSRITALCLGPGFGVSPREAAMLHEALAAGRGTVLDADAITLLAQEAALTGALHEGCVLTPHEGEFARLFPDLAQRMADGLSRIDAVREAAARLDAVVLLKGRATVIAAPDGQVALHAAAYGREAPWLATAGSGDVLAGIVTGLLARGWGAFGAACTGAWLHVEAARVFGAGLIAEDLPDALPAVFRRLGV